MKTLATLIILSFLITSAKAQDLIILKNGSEIEAKVMEVNLSDIKYKKLDNPDGPSYSVQKSEVFIIKYKNGTKDIINSISDSEQKNKSSVSNSADRSLTTNGTVELGGDISFISQGVIGQEVSGGSASNTAFSFSPYIGIVAAGGFELGLIPELITNSGTGGASTDFNMFIAPAYNFSDNRAYPFIEFLVGYNSTSEDIGGVGVGGSGGLKLQFGGNGLLVFAFRYLHQSYSLSGSSFNEGFNTVSLEIGTRIFISRKK